jgi:hypothetical protein
VLGVAFILDLAGHYLLLEGRILGKENKVFSMLFWDFDSDLHGVLLSV